MPINLDKLFVEVANYTVPSLLISSATTDVRARIGVCYGYDGVYFSTASGTIDVSSFSCDALRVSFPIASSTVSIDHEDFLRKASRWGCSGGDEVGDGLSDVFGGDFRFCSQICLQDREQRVIIELMDLHHVDGWCKLVGARQNELSERMHVADLVGVEIMHGLLIGSSRVGQPVG
jgi:hypothetical protein